MKHPLSLLLLSAMAPPLLAQDWQTTGNAGIVGNVNFIGTTDDQPLMFRKNNTHAGTLNDALDNVFLGINAGLHNTTGYQNTAVGDNTFKLNTTGYRNTAFGRSALTNNSSGAMNAAFGREAMKANNEGLGNAAFGAFALFQNTAGNNNCAAGYNALPNNTRGGQNVAIGYLANGDGVAGNYAVAIGSLALGHTNAADVIYEHSNTAIGYNAMKGAALAATGSPDDNTAVGYEALLAHDEGYGNTAIGRSALVGNTSGYYNTAMGYVALSGITTGSYNTAIGYSATASGSTWSNATALGYTATASTSNKVRLGNTLVSVVEGQVPYSSPSDARYKLDVQEDVPGLDLILALRPVSYGFDRLALAKHVHEDLEGREAEFAQADQERTTGLLAQEAEAAMQLSRFPAFGTLHAPDNPTDHYSLAYSQLVVPLVKAVQELQAINQARKAELQELRTSLNERITQARELPADDK
jgi:hypothetical protein